MSEAIAAVRAMLVGNAALTNVVPATRITAGEVGQDTAWPAVVLLHNFTDREGNVAYQRGEEYLRTAIEIVPMAKGYAEMASLVQLIEVAVHGQRGVFDGVSVHSCMRTSVGQDDFFDEQGLWARPVVVTLVYTRP